jgi:hypothetical protein
MVVRRGGGARKAVLAILAVGILSGAMASHPAPRRFTSPEEAFGALVDALKRDDTHALIEILGSKACPLVFSGDAVADASARRKFVDEWQTAHVISPVDDTKSTVAIGSDGWPFPIPVVRHGSCWRFDAAAGIDELLTRRIGRNEIEAIQVVQAYVDAQREYAMVSHDGSGLPVYAQKFQSTPGKRDGLHWEAKPGEEPSPLGALVAKARAEGYRAGPKSRGEPYHGYFYRILTRQGPHAPGGAYDYVVGGKMIGGFGLIATPAVYGVSGVMTFVVNQDGAVFQKDLGPHTASLARRMMCFDPDPSSWTPVDEAPPSS